MSLANGLSILFIFSKIQLLVLLIYVIFLFSFSFISDLIFMISFLLLLPGSVLQGYTFLRICPFLPGCPFYWHRVACSALRMLCISAVSVVTSPFSFLILLIWVLSLFFLMSLANGLSILFILSKSQPLVLLIFAIVFFVSVSFISALIFMISFFLLTLGFVCSSFCSSFRCNVRLFIWDFSCFLR